MIATVKDSGFFSIFKGGADNPKEAFIAALPKFIAKGGTLDDTNPEIRIIRRYATLHGEDTIIAFCKAGGDFRNSSPDEETNVASSGPGAVEAFHKLGGAEFFNGQNSDGKNAFMVAVEGHGAAGIEALVAAGCKPDGGKRDRWGRNEAMHAIMAGEGAVYAYVEAGGVFNNATDNTKVSEAMHAIKKGRKVFEAYMTCDGKMSTLDEKLAALRLYPDDVDVALSKVLRERGLGPLEPSTPVDPQLIALRLA